MEFSFLEPVNDEVADFLNLLNTQQLGSKVVFHTREDFPDLNKITIAVLGVLELSDNQNIGDLTSIRKNLYSLYPGNWETSIADLGDIKPGHEMKDTYFALKSIVSALLKRKILPIIIGGTQDLTYPIYRGYDDMEQMVNLVSVDSKFDFGKESDPISADSYLSKIILDEPHNLFNFCNLGYQTYYNAQEEIDLIEKLFFDCYRLGDIVSNIELAEPVMRDADFISLDLTSVRSSDSGNFSRFVPNGFSGKEICILARYAGISDRVSAFGVFNRGNSELESALIAQIIWYFIEGFHYRAMEYPYGSKENYLKYIVPFEDEELVFYKSNKTERWWIQIPHFSSGNNKLKKSSLLPCSYEEYIAACSNEIPERWWKAQRKTMQ